MTGESVMPDLPSSGSGHDLIPESEARDSIRISSRSLALVAGIVAIAALVALAVISSTKKVDTLSTIALVLAIITFAAQLIQTIGLTLLTSNQHRQVVETNTKTQEALAEIRVATGEIMVRRDQHFERLLESIVPSALAESVATSAEIGDGIDIDALSKRFINSALGQLESDRGPSMDPSRPWHVDDLFSSRPRARSALRLLGASEQLGIWKALASLSRESLEKMDDNALTHWIQENTSHS